MERFGDVLYNLYGSTEVAWAAIATPEDMHAAPGTVGRPPLRDGAAHLRRGRATRSLRDRPAASSSATRCSSRATPAAASKDTIDGLMATGDVGHFDDGGRLFVDGRDDDMIVSGGENVFPQEVEDAALRPRRDRRRGGARRGRREVRPAAARGDRHAPRGQALRVRASRTTSSATSRTTRCRATSIFIDELPRTSTGKVLKRELRDARTATATADRAHASTSPSSRPAPSRDGPARSTVEHRVERGTQPGRVERRVGVVGVRRAAVAQAAVGVDHEDVGRGLWRRRRARPPGSRRGGRASTSPRGPRARSSSRGVARVALRRRWG